MTKEIEAMVHFKCPALQAEIDIPLAELDFDWSGRKGFSADVFCECGNYHDLLKEQGND